MHAPQEIRTFFVTSVNNRRRPISKAEEMARLLIDVFNENRSKDRFLLHEFVIMPDHFHLILTPSEDVSLEKALQFIKGGFSFRAKRELRYPYLIWEEGLTNHRIRDEEGLRQSPQLHPPEPSRGPTLQNRTGVPVLFRLPRNSH